jgi:hypothetical protein
MTTPTSSLAQQKEKCSSLLTQVYLEMAKQAKIPCQGVQIVWKRFAKEDPYCKLQFKQASNAPHGNVLYRPLPPHSREILNALMAKKESHAIAYLRTIVLQWFQIDSTIVCKERGHVRPGNYVMSCSKKNEGILCVDDAMDIFEPKEFEEIVEEPAAFFYHNQSLLKPPYVEVCFRKVLGSHIKQKEGTYVYVSKRYCQFIIQQGKNIEMRLTGSLKATPSEEKAKS